MTSSSDTRRGMMRWAVALIVIAALAVAAVLLVPRWLTPALPNSASSTKSPLNFRLKWLIYSGFTPHFVALEKGYYTAEGLDVRIEPGGPGIDPLRMVLAGEADVGLASYDQILLAREKGLPLIAIGEDTVQSGVGFLSLASYGITKPEDFVGRKVGVMPGTDKGTMYEALMSRLGIDRSKINEIPVQFNLSVLFNGTVEVFPAFITNQPIIANDAGFEVNVIDPGKYGIRPGGNVFFTSESTLKQKRDLLRSFLRAELRAIMDAQTMDDGEAVDCVLKHNDQLKRDTEIQIWRATKSMLSPTDRTRVGVMDRKTWEHTADLFHSTGLLTTIPNLDECFTNELVEEVHKKGL